MQGSSSGSTYVYDVPLSSMTTALSDGAPGTLLFRGTTVLLLASRMASRSTVQRVGSDTGNVEIFGLFATSL